jgi:hypothetical protein
MIPLLALIMTVAIAASAHAQYRYDQRSDGPSATIQITFGSAPHWTEVRGTRVQEIREGERPDYDMFRLDNSYYVYNNSRWYTSNDWRGSFRYVDDSSVPSELSRVPREHWRQYPAEWQNRSDQGWQDRNDRSMQDRSDRGWQDRRDRDSQASGTLQINFGRQPRWTTVRGTRVSMIRQGQRPDYDMFRYGNTYYVYSNDQWYMSRQWRGEFRAIDARMVPRQFAYVPRHHWRNYPQDWSDRYDNSRDDQGRHRR